MILYHFQHSSVPDAAWNVLIQAINAQETYFHSLMKAASVQGGLVWGYKSQKIALLIYDDKIIGPAKCLKNLKITVSPDFFNKHFIDSGCSYEFHKRLFAINYDQSSNLLQSQTVAPSNLLADQIKVIKECGNKLFQLKLFDLALQTYKKGLQMILNSKYKTELKKFRAHLLNNISAVYFELKDYAKSLEYCGKALHLHPDYDKVKKRASKISKILKQ